MKLSTTTTPDPNGDDSNWIRYLVLRCVLSHRHTAIAAFSAAAAAAIFTAVLPLIVRHVVDTLTQTAASVIGWMILVWVVGLARFASSCTRRVSSSKLSLGVQHDLRRDLFAALLRLDGRAQGTLQTGQVVSRAITDVTLIQMFLQLIPMVAGNLVMLVSSLALMLVMSPALSVVAAVIVPVLWVITRRSQRDLFPANWHAQAKAAEVAMRVEAAVAGVRVVKAFAQEGYELDRLEDRARDLYRSRLRITHITSRFTPAIQAVPAIGQALILIAGGLLALQQSITLGTFLAFMTYLGSFVSPIRQFSMLLTVSQQGKASLDRVREVISAPVRPERPSRRPAVFDGPPSVEFRDVQFSFGTSTVLDGLTLRVEPGETMAIAGGAGSGKSILVQLLPGLFDPDAGSVRFGGTDIRELADARSQVAMVFEDTHLMADTVRANVAYGRAGATDDEIWHALWLASADEFVTNLPEQLDTRIGERGQRLSGGQRQRIALARALLTDAPILVLDDATSAIDARVEEQIFARIDMEVQRRTTLLVGHRISTLWLADRVAVLDRGGVAELGTVHDLQRSGELFRSLFTPPDIASIGAEPTRGEVQQPWATADLWIEPAKVDGSDTLAQVARVFSHRAAGGGGAMGHAGGGPGMLASAPPSGDVQALIDRLPPATGSPDVPDSFARTPDPQFSLKRLLRPFAAPLLAGLALVALDALAQILIPFLVRYGIDHGVLARARDVLVVTAALAIILVVADWAISVTQVRIMGKASERLLFGLRVKAFAQLQRLGLPYYERELGGRIMTRMTSDVDGLSNFLQTGFATALTSTITIAGVVAALVVIDVRLSFVVLVLLPILVVITALFGRASIPAYSLARDRVSAVNAYLQENVDNIRVTQAYRREVLNQKEFERRSWGYRNARMRSQTLMAVFFPFVEFMSVVATTLVLGVGVHDVRHGTLTVGTLIAFQLYIELLFSPIQQLSQVFDSYQQAAIGVDRLSRLFCEPIATPEADDAEPVANLDGSIEFRGLGYTYDTRDIPVLADLNLRIDPGQKVALVGESGAGKTTLIKLLARFYDPTEGSVIIDGVDVRRYRLHDFRKRLGVVPQEAYLFGDNVRDAIAYGAPDATAADIEWAARAVGVHEMIADLAGGYCQPIGDNGQKLSAGQRQLLALARAQLVDPDILILDEATASLDLATEAKVRAAVDVLTTGRTTIVVAHRLATAADADLIAVFGGGRLLQTGTHSDLLGVAGPYQRLWAAYVGDSSAPGRKPVQHRGIRGRAVERTSS
jgi:ATP-binding cassette subfamily B protein